jgi:hypothetical protein
VGTARTGWDAITAAMERVNRDPAPWHSAEDPPLALGGDVERISGYRADGHWHLVTYAMSELRGKETVDRKRSGLGFELTMRVPRPDGEAGPPPWGASLLRFICRWARATGTHLAEGHFLVLPDWLPSEGWPRPWPAVAFVADTTLGSIRTPNGRLRFLQVVSLDDVALAGLTLGAPRKTLAAVEAVHGQDRLRVAAPTLPVG